MKPTFQVINSIGNYLNINNTFDYLGISYLSQNESTGVTTVHADNTTPFQTTGILLLSGDANSNSEYVTYSAKPTSTTFTTSATVLTHVRGDSVKEAMYNQVVIESSSTIGGSYTVVATISIDPTQTATRYQHAAGTPGLYYRIALKNSVTSAVSEYSEPVEAALPLYNSAQYIMNQVIRDMKINANDPILTQEFLFNQLNVARTLLDNLAYGQRWEWRQKFNIPFQILAGTNYVTLPDDIDFATTNRSVLAVRISNYNYGLPYPLNYIDKKDWNNISMIQQGSTVKNPITAGDTSITLNNTGDFAPSGNAFIATDDVSQSILVVQYTANDVSTGTLSGISALAITRSVPVGTQVWARNVGTILPFCYTLFDDRLMLDQVIPDTLQGRNIYLDYYTRMQPLEAPNEVLPEHYSHIYMYYLKYACKKAKDSSLDTSDPDYVMFESQAKAVTGNQYTGQTTRVFTS